VVQKILTKTWNRQKQNKTSASSSKANKH